MNPLTKSEELPDERPDVTSDLQYPFTKDKRDVDDAFLECVAEGWIDRSGGKRQVNGII